MFGNRRNRLGLGIAILWLLGTTGVHGQNPGSDAPAPDVVVAPAPCDPRVWFEADYLLWWIRKSPVPTPLVTAGNVNDPLPGVLGQPSTVVLFGGKDIDYGTFSGMRLSLGAAIDPEGTFLVQGSWLALERGSTSFTAGGDGTGTNVIARPLISAFTGLEFAEATSFPGNAAFPFNYAGTTSVTTTTHFQAYELNLGANFLRDEGARFTFLAGFRALDLDESISIRDNLVPITAGILTFQGTPFDFPTTLADYDSFRVSNKFYGGQIGGQYGLQFGAFDLAAIAKIALGVTQQTATIDGATFLMPPGVAPVMAPGGILALPTNMGSRSRETFSVVPELDLNAGWKITPRIEAHVGYSLLFWTNVVRPGSLIDRTVNFNQIASDPGFGLFPGGAARPGFVASQTNFWAQGINFGMKFSF